MTVMYTNMELRQLVDFCGISLKELADKMHSTPFVVSMWFASEISDERKVEIRKAIKEIIEERTKKS